MCVTYFVFSSMVTKQVLIKIPCNKMSFLFFLLRLFMTFAVYLTIRVDRFLAEPRSQYKKWKTGFFEWATIDQANEKLYIISPFNIPPFSYFNIGTGLK